MQNSLKNQIVHCIVELVGCLQESTLSPKLRLVNQKQRMKPNGNDVNRDDFLGMLCGHGIRHTLND